MKRNNKIKDTVTERIFYFFNYIFLLFVVFITLYPFWHSLIASISVPSRLMIHEGVLLLPLGIDFISYKSVFENPNIINGFYNTIYILVVAVTINFILTVIAAYALSRRDLYFGKALTIFFLLTMFVSGGLIPLYLVVDKLNLLNTRWAIILPTIINTYNVIITKVYFSNIPDSMEESARLDGANDFIILFRIYVPMSIPICAVVILYFAVFKWNGWFHPMIFLNKRELFPLQLLLREILITNSVGDMVTNIQVSDKEPIAESIKYATMMVSVIPIIMVYPFLQKYFVSGIMIGSVKE